MLWPTQKLCDLIAEQCPKLIDKENILVDVTVPKATDGKLKSVDSQSSNHQREPLSENMRDKLERATSISAELADKPNPEKSLGKRESCFPFETYRFLGTRLGAALKENPTTPKNASSPKDDLLQAPNAEGVIYTMEDFRNGLAKHIAKIKYFWRGTNFNNPYAFHRFYRISKKRRVLSRLATLDEPKGENDKDFSQIHNSEGECEDDDDEGDHFLLQEDYSNKLINPADKFYK